MKTKNEDIIKKLFESKCSLSPEERAALNNYEYVNDTFHRQWEEMSEEAVDLVREEKIPVSYTHLTLPTKLEV